MTVSRRPNPLAAARTRSSAGPYSSHAVHFTVPKLPMPTPPSLLKRQASLSNGGALSPTTLPPVPVSRSHPNSPVSRFAPLSPASSRASSVPAETPSPATTPTTPGETVKQLDFALAQVAQSVP
ncbi:uncharacterized protein LOC62_03G003644 [Vanrija pseudolonga]|uniref:Uncharacterized protein n=1 Tax=Vanrija pseudolonga TaxID=143232 RepID=A0AAF0Y9C7_9TREE|nr:hypothetical protein LOC62_03G003644 [Vanrija pseudolonga]